MRILILQDDFPPEMLGGAGMVAFNLSSQLQKMGHEIFVITTVTDRAKAGVMDYKGLTLYRLYSNYHTRWCAYLSLYNPGIVSRVKQLIQQINPDVIHAHNVHYHLSYHSLKLAKKFNKPLFLTAHDAMPFHYAKLVEFINQNDLTIPEKFDYRISPWQQIKRFKKRYNPFRNMVIKNYLKYPDRILFVSGALREAWRQNGLEGSAVVHNGIDVGQWEFKQTDFKEKYGLTGKKIVLFGGKLNYWKGGDYILEAMEKVCKKIDNAVLLVVGRESECLKKMKERAQVSLVNTGWLESEQVKAAFHNSDLVVTPSICFDSFPTINLEAMACRKPVVGTCFGGTPEIVQDGVTGYIVNPFNTKDMAEKIADLLNNEEKAKRFGQAGYERVKEHFSLQQQAEKVLKIYGGEKICECY